MKYSDISITPLKHDRYRVNVPIVYKDVHVPIGYRTNGADIPRIFWSVFPPNKSDFMPAVIVHDYLYEQGELEKADIYFKEILESLRVNQYQIWILYTAVCLHTKYKKIKGS